MKEAGLRFGIIYGASGVLLTLICYWVDPIWLFGTWYTALTGMLLCIPFMYLAAIAERQKYDGYMTFGEGIRPAFLTFLIGSFIIIFFKFILINFIDTGLIDLQLAEAKRTALYLAETMGTPAAEIAELRKELEANPPESKIHDQFLYWLVGMIFPGLVLCLIIAFLARKNPVPNAGQNT